MASVSTFVNRGFNTTTQGSSSYQLLKGARAVGDAPDLRAQKNEVGVQRQVVPSRKIKIPDSGESDTPDGPTGPSTTRGPSIADELSKASIRTMGLQVGSLAPVVGPLFGAAAAASKVDEQIDAANKAMKTGVFSELAQGVEPFSKFGDEALSVALPFGKDITDEVIGAIAKSGNVVTSATPKSTFNQGVIPGLTVSPDVVTAQLESLSRQKGPVLSQIDKEGIDVGPGPRANPGKDAKATLSQNIRTAKGTRDKASPPTAFPTGKISMKAMTAPSAPVSTYEGPVINYSTDPTWDDPDAMKGGKGVTVGPIGSIMGPKGTPWSSGVKTTGRLHPDGPFIVKHDVTISPLTKQNANNLNGGGPGVGGGSGVGSRSNLGPDWGLTPEAYAGVSEGGDSTEDSSGLGEDSDDFGVF
jgi:hypothetical protein